MKDKNKYLCPPQHISPPYLLGNSIITHSIFRVIDPWNFSFTQISFIHDKKLSILYFLYSILNYRNKELKIIKISAFKESEDQWQKCCNGEMFLFKAVPHYLLGAKWLSVSLEKRYNLNVKIPKW